MTTTISTIIPDPEELLNLEPEELAGSLIQFLNSLDANTRRQILHRNRICAEEGVKGYPPSYFEQISHALMEAWIWLEREGLIAPRPTSREGYSFITRLGQKMKNAEDLKSFRHPNLLSRDMLHPIIAKKAWSSFVRGEYDTAVFKAFKEVEIAVRKAGGFKNADIGVVLMRKAFNTETGPLTNQDLPEAEREAMAHLFAGSIGLFKNPGSHREVLISNPDEAVELITLASRLLKIVDGRENND